MHVQAAKQAASCSACGSKMMIETYLVRLTPTLPLRRWIDSSLYAAALLIVVTWCVRLEPASWAKWLAVHTTSTTAVRCTWVRECFLDSKPSSSTTSVRADSSILDGETRSVWSQNCATEILHLLCSKQSRRQYNAHVIVLETLKTTGTTYTFYEREEKSEETKEN